MQKANKTNDHDQKHHDNDVMFLLKKVGESNVENCLFSTIAIGQMKRVLDGFTSVPGQRVRK